MNGTYDLINEIKRLKKEKNAIILAHVYQDSNIQDIADYTGDSLDLSRKATSTNADVIVFCGVRFMAETAYLLNPAKTVLLPDEEAGCGLAEMAAVEQLKSKKKEYPDAAVVSYVNSSAAIKAESDICCTSANAIDIINSLPQEKILFLPDKNLGSYVAEHTDKDVFPWDGFCYVHENIKLDQLGQLKKNTSKCRDNCPSRMYHTCKTFCRFHRQYFADVTICRFGRTKGVYCWNRR